MLLSCNEWGIIRKQNAPKSQRRNEIGPNHTK